MFCSEEPVPVQSYQHLDGIDQAKGRNGRFTNRDEWVIQFMGETASHLRIRAPL